MKIQNIIDKKGEEQIFNIIQEFLNKNRFFETDKIISFIASRVAQKKININTNGIIAVLETFAKKYIIVERSKLVRDDVLLNLNRRIIYDFITANPGVHFFSLVKNLSIIPSVIEWHLNILLKFNLIIEEKIEDLKVYFNSKIKPDDYRDLCIISREKSKKIINYLRNHVEGATKNYLSKKLGIHRNTITKYIIKLEECDLLIRREESHKTFYILNEKRYEQLIDKVNISDEQTIEEEIKVIRTTNTIRSEAESEIENIKLRILTIKGEIKKIENQFAAKTISEVNYFNEKTNLYQKLGELEGKLSLYEEKKTN